MSQHEGELLPLISEFADDQEMIELIELFVAEMPARVRALESAFSDTAFGDLQRLAHQLRGAAPCYGFPAIGAAAAEVERAAQRDAGLEEMRAQLDELIILCQRAGLDG